MRVDIQENAGGTFKGKAGDVYANEKNDILIVLYDVNDDELSGALYKDGFWQPMKLPATLPVNWRKLADGTTITLTVGNGN